MRRILEPIERLHADEEGAALTEFVMVLPIFIFIFAGIAHMGSFQRASTKTWGAAYQETWRAALPVAAGEGERHHSAPATAGARAITDLGTNQPHNRVESARTATSDAEARTYASLRSDGDFGESGRRVESAQEVVRVPRVDSRVAPSSAGLVQESRLAGRVFEPGRVARATGGQYGVAVGQRSKRHTVAGFTMEMHAHFNVLVAPAGAPTVATAEAAASGPEGLDPYENLMGIAWDQPLRTDSIRVDRVIEGEE